MKRLKTVAIVQARLGSTRLPGKVLADIAGQPMLWHVIQRLRRATALDDIWVATSEQASDDALAAYCAAQGFAVFRGSEEDVLDRYYQAARAAAADFVVRITADCPLLDPAVVDKVVRAFDSARHDYVANVFRYTYPDGLDTEVFSFAALERAWHEAVPGPEREHVTVLMRTSGRFRTGANVEHTTDLSRRQLRWTVDTAADLAFVRRVFAAFGDQPFGLEEVLGLLEKNPTLTQMNESSIRNEGYYLSLAKEPPLPPQKRALTRSAELASRARRLIPGGSQTFSKAPTQFVQGVAPNFITRGRGSHVWDADGNEYIDYPMALAPVVLGHADPEVTEAVVLQIQDGTTYSLPHLLEVEVAELLVELVPCAEMVRFAKNGSDATAGAVRVARAFTGREVVACCGYHGWQDWYIGTTTRNKGVPKAVQELTRTFAYNDLAGLEKIFAEQPGRVAAVVMEPTGVVEPQPGFLAGVKELTHRHGAVLVYDEIVTGFRWAIGGAQEFFGVTPDLACCGKAMGNGYPIAAVMGRRDLMEVFDEVFFSFTFGGETASLAASKAVLEKLRREPVIPHLWEQGQKLKDGYNTLAAAFGVAAHTACVGYAPRSVLTFKDASGAESLLLKSLFQQECLKRGILFSGGQNLSYAHSNADIEHTLRVYRSAMEIFADALRAGDVERRLEGPPVQPVFRRA